MTAAWGEARRASANPNQLLEAQRAFTRQRGQCQNPRCIADITRQRTAELKAITAATLLSSPSQNDGASQRPQAERPSQPSNIFSQMTNVDSEREANSELLIQSVLEPALSGRIYHISVKPAKEYVDPWNLFNVIIPFEYQINKDYLEAAKQTAARIASTIERVPYNSRCGFDESSVNSGVVLEFVRFTDLSGRVERGDSERFLIAGVREKLEIKGYIIPTGNIHPGIWRGPLKLSARSPVTLDFNILDKNEISIFSYFWSLTVVDPGPVLRPPNYVEKYSIPDSFDKPSVGTKNSPSMVPIHLMYSPLHTVRGGNTLNACMNNIQIPVNIANTSEVLLRMPLEMMKSASRVVVKIRQ